MDPDSPVRSPTSRRAVLTGVAAGGLAAIAGCRRGLPSDVASILATSASLGPTSASSGPIDLDSSSRRPSPNWFLSGNFAPVPFETTALRLPVEGRLPDGLNGTLFRIGPNPLEADPARYHWFLGTGMVHAFTFDEGQLSYRSRWVRTHTAAAALGESGLPEQPEDPFPIPNGANNTVTSHAGRLLATYEAGLPTEIGPDLTTRGRYNFGGELTGPMTAHAKTDPSTGELFFFGIDFLAQPHLHYYRADADGRIVETREIDLPGPSMMHDFGLTERYVVFIDVPVVYDLAGLQDRPIPAGWRNDYVSRIGVMPRTGGGTIKWFEIDPSYVAHVLNAYDIDDLVVLDGPRHTSFFDKDIHGVGEGTVTLDRWTMNLTTGQVRHDVLDERSQELPRINDRLVGRRHRFGYTVLTNQEGGRFGLGGIMKHDLETGTNTLASLPDSAQACEPVFVARPGSTAEDDGWVVSIMYEDATDLSTVVVFEAQDIAALPIASIPLGVRVPHHFHGTFVPG